MPTPPSLRRACTLGALTFGLVAPALGAQSNDRRPSVAVLPFENAAMINGADYAPLSKGVAEMLITSLAGNPGVRVVERDRLQKLIDEQNLSAGGRVDKESAVRLGKVVGAHHMLTGTFVIDPKQRVRLVVRSINTETSEIEYAESVSGKADDMLPLIDQLGAKMNAGLKLPPMPIRLSQPSATPGAGATETARSETPKGEAKGGANQFRAMMMVSRALEKQDRGDMPGAIALYKNALQEYPTFERAKTLLASAEGAPGTAAPARPQR